MHSGNWSIGTLQLKILRAKSEALRRGSKPRAGLMGLVQSDGQEKAKEDSCVEKLRVV